MFANILPGAMLLEVVGRLGEDFGWLELDAAATWSTTYTLVAGGPASTAGAYSFATPTMGREVRRLAALGVMLRNAGTPAESWGR